LRGRLRVDGKLFRAGDGGRFVWRFASGFALAHLYATDRPKAEAYLDWVQATGFNGVRVLVGNLTWAGQTFATAERGLPALLEATAQRGLYCELTALSDTKDVTQAKGEWHVGAIAAMAAQAENCVLELGNEIGHSTQAGWLTQGWAKGFGPRIPGSLAWAVGAPVGQDEALSDGTFGGSGGKYITSHLDRGRPFWEQVRRVRELMGLKDSFKVPVVNNEPIGAGPVQQNGRRETNPVFFRALGALNSLMGVQGVFHLDAGLKCSMPSAVETACGKAFLEGHSVMGDEAGTLQYQNAGFSASPVKSIQNLTRAYSFIGGSAGYTIALGQTPTSRIEWQGGWKVTDTVLSGGGMTVWRVAK